MDIQKEFSENYMEDGALYKNAENKLKATRKKLENEEPDESSDEPINDSWIQAVKIWIEVEDAAKAKKTETTSKAAKKRDESYAAFKLRQDLALNLSKKKLITLPDFNNNEEEYSTEDRDKSTASEDDNELAIDSSTTTSRSSSMLLKKRKTQAQKLSRTKIGKKRKPRINEIAPTISKLDGIINGLRSLVFNEKD